MRKSGRWRRASTIGGLACLSPCIFYVAVTFAIFGPAKVKQDGENRRRGADVATLVTAYRQAHGRYPATIDELEAAPHPVRRGVEIDSPFGYAVTESGEHFTLQFMEAPMMPMDDDRGFYQWSSRAQAWNWLPPPSYE